MSIFKAFINSVADGRHLRLLRRRLSGDDALVLDREELRQAGTIFTDGFDFAMRASRCELISEIQRLPLVYQGFAFEGGAIALGISGDNNWDSICDYLSELESYQLHAVMGCGGAFAHAGVAPASVPSNVDSYWHGLLMDGYGFHQAFFNWHTVLLDQKRPFSQHQPASAKAYDQGVGRALWYAANGRPSDISNLISQFAEERRGDLWYGAAMQATYSGVTEKEYLKLRTIDERYLPHLTAGTAFGTVVRVNSGFIPDYTRYACRLFCGEDAGNVEEIYGEQLIQARNTNSDKFSIDLQGQVAELILR